MMRWMPTLPVISRVSPAPSTNTQALWQTEPSRTQIVQRDSAMKSPTAIASSTWPPAESMSSTRLSMPSSSATAVVRSISAVKSEVTRPL